MLDACDSLGGDFFRDVPFKADRLRAPEVPVPGDGEGRGDDPGLEDDRMTLEEPRAERDAMSCVLWRSRGSGDRRHGKMGERG